MIRDRKNIAIQLDFIVFYDDSELACTQNFLNSCECLNFGSEVFGNLELMDERRDPGSSTLLVVSGSLEHLF
jgi:hypothetical protein